MSIMLIHSVYSYNVGSVPRMMSPRGGLTVEKIDRIYLCAECRMVFLFKSDVDDHLDMKGHAGLRTMPFE
jgi:hypothetical protein